MWKATLITWTATLALLTGTVSLAASEAELPAPGGLTPRNVFVAPSGRVSVIGWGVPQLEILDAAIDAFDEGTRSQMTDTQASTLASQA